MVDLFNQPEVQDVEYAFLNAGFGYVAAVEDITREAFAKQLETNLLGTWDFFHYLMQIFRKNGKGRILVTSSVIGFSPVPFRGAYGASKAALETLVQTARVENQNPNIQISLLCPGPVVTNFRATANKFYTEHTKEQMDKSAYNAEYQAQEQRLARTGKKKFAVSPLEVAKVVEKCFKSKKQKTRYLICLPTYFV